MADAKEGTSVTAEVLAAFLKDKGLKFPVETAQKLYAGGWVHPGYV